VSAFLLALAYRSWSLTRSDEVEDDVEDRRIAAMIAAREDTSGPEGAAAGERSEERGMP
jgi:multicomponent Na+:H+ antiporter subunit C